MENLEKKEELKVEGMYSERFKELCASLDHAAEIVNNMRKLSKKSHELNDKIIADINQQLIDLGVIPIELSQTPESRAEKYSREDLEIATEINMMLINKWARGWAIPTSLDYKSIIEKSRETKEMLASLPQEDYKSRYIISTKTVEFFVSEYERIRFQGDDKGIPVKKIGTKK